MTTQPDKDTLLVEYEACLMDASQLDNDMWQSSGIFIGLSMIGFTLLIQPQGSNWDDFAVYVIITTFGLALLGIWNRLLTGWFRLIHVNFYRMRNIEMKLGMRRELLIAHIDEITERLPYPEGLAGELSSLKSELSKRGLSGRGLGGPTGVQRTLSWVVRFIAIGWITLLAKQLIYLLFIL